MALSHDPMPSVNAPAALSMTKSFFSPFSTLTITSETGTHCGGDFFFVRAQPEQDKFVSHLLCLLTNQYSSGLLLCSPPSSSPSHPLNSEHPEFPRVLWPCFVFVLLSYFIRKPHSSLKPCFEEPSSRILPWLPLPTFWVQSLSFSLTITLCDNVV